MAVSADDLPYRDCVGMMVVNNDRLIFAGERNALAGSWQMPQGGIDKGEEASAAALRELEEETGILAVTEIGRIDRWLHYDLPTDLIGKALKGRYRGQRQRWFAYRFDGHDSDINVISVDHPEFTSWRWMEPEALEASVIAFKRHIYRDVFEEFRPLLED